MGHFVVAAIIGAIEPINKEVANSLAKMVKDQMFRLISVNLLFQFYVTKMQKNHVYFHNPKF